MKRLFWFILSTLLGLGFTACGGGADSDEVFEPIMTPHPSATVSGATAKVRWSAVAHAEAYLCELTADNNTPTTEQVTTTEYTFTMTSGCRYQVRVKALPGKNKGYTESDWSIAVTFTYIEDQEPDPTPPPMPPQAATLQFPAAEQDGVIRAFPGAEGGGMYTTGGRGGKVIHVTNLNDSGEGSLRAAVEASGARTIVFDVAGTIELKSNLRIRNGNLTIAGQTAPGGGVCLSKYSTVVEADNVIIRYLRFRPGVNGANDSDGLDALWGRYHKNIIIDHCSMSWSTDECTSFYANQNFTMQWCLLAESLHNAGHTKGSHGYGGVWDGVSASFHHNLLANHDSRNPRFGSPNTYYPNSKEHDIKQSERSIDYRNNVVYNFCSNAAYGGEGGKMNFVANYYKWGPGSIKGKGTSYKNGSSSENGGKRRAYFYSVDGRYTSGGVTYDEGAAHIYTEGNSNYFDSSIDPSSSVGAQLMADNRRGFPLSEGSISEKSPEVTWLDRVLPIRYNGTACSVTSHTATMAYERVLDYAGASLCRDAVDARNVTHTRAATFSKNGSMGSKNGIIDLPSDVGGYPTLSATEEEIARAVTDTDKDNVPDYYEELLGLDKTKADATLKTLDPQGLYTNFEVYLHYLVQAITSAQTDGGNYTKLE
ncbi:MAG: pectate lyase [Alistipes sp.]|nr:pectate lyase [Alistipes sp.]